MSIVIEIVGRKSGKTTVLDEASSKKEARDQVDYWQQMKGKGWKISTRPK